MASMQQVIQKLSMFWDEQGCAVLPPCTFQVPLGLLHPQAFFRLLDPDPWMAAFLQPISRPADSRRGLHPYRSARHLQLQVVWKHDDPTAPHDAFTAGLEALGIDTRRHDLRWIADDLVIEAIGARGAGWRVQLNGLEIGRIHFLQQLAGGPSPAAVEIAYGIDRLALFLSEADSIYAVPWQGSLAPTRQTPSPELSENATDKRRENHREKRREAEEELYLYTREVADVGYLRQVIDGLDRESARCLEAELPTAAYELAVRSLPPLDQLHIRGALSTRERSQWLSQIQSRVVAAAELYRRRYHLDSEAGASHADQTPPNEARQQKEPSHG